MFDKRHLVLREYVVPSGFFEILITNSFFCKSKSNFFMNSSSLASSDAIFDVKTCFGNIEKR